VPTVGDVERFAATSLYPWRFAIAVLVVTAVAGFLVLAARRGWFTAARRHPGRTGALVVAALVLLAPAAWYLGSPLFIRTELHEPPPQAVIATPSVNPVRPVTTSTPASAPASALPATPVPTPTATPLVRSGRFVGADDFSVRNGPDLFVYLSPDPKGSTGRAIELGRLRATDGSFNTPIPAGTDVGRARSVVIWCKEFSVLFAVATLDR
jgi:hypothetical protein